MRLPASYAASDARVAVLRARGLPLLKPTCSAVWEMPRDSPVRCHSRLSVKVTRIVFSHPFLPQAEGFSAEGGGRVL